MATFSLKGVMPQERQERKYDGDLAFLNREKELKNEHGTDIFSQEFSQKGSRQVVLKTMNALRVVSPVICALMTHPGLEGKPKDISDAFKKIFTDVSYVSEKICEKLGVNPKEETNYWIKNVFEKNVSEIIRAQWETNNSANVDEILPLMDNILQVAERMSDTQTYEDISPVNNVRASVFRSMIPILMEYTNGYHLYRSNIEDDLEEIATVIFDVCVSACEELADSYSDAPSRAKLFHLLSTQATQLYLAAWRAEGMILEDMINKNPDRADDLRDKCFKNGGLPLQKVENAFKKQFQRLVAVTQRLTTTGSRK